MSKPELNIKEIQKKVKLAAELYDFAFEIKMTALKNQYPEKSKDEIRAMTLAIFHKKGR